MKKLFKAILILFGVLLVLLTAASFHPEVQNVYRALRASTQYDSEPPSLPENLPDPAILIFSKTNGFRHSGAIEAGTSVLQDIAKQLGGSAYATENSAVFTSSLINRFRVVVFHNASGAPLAADQRAVLQSWIENGGGFVGIHAALDDSHKGWPWYQRELVGAKFIGHIMGPQFQAANLQVEAANHSAMAGLAPTWQHTEEWYSFENSVRGQTATEILATVDESTYTPRMKFLWIDKDVSMGDHPVIWTRQIGRGRAFLTALGHAPETYQTPEYQAILKGAIQWAATTPAELQ